MTIPRIRTLALLAITASVAGAMPIAAASPASAVSAAQNPTSCSAVTAVVNGGFESPAMTPGAWGSFADADVPGWQTTAPDGMFEYWGDGYNGVDAAEGTAFAELNANAVSTLYQDVPTTPGATLMWSLQHRGRLGVDTLRVLIGDPAGPLSQSGPDLSDGELAWGAHSGSYVVPAGQTTTRFAFESVDAAGGDPTFGNFLDAVSFGTSPCLIVSKTVRTLSGSASAGSGDTVRYTVTVTNRGGVDARLTEVTDTLPAGIAYVPGSLVVTAGPGAGGLTDAAGDDPGEYDDATRQLTVRLGIGADALAGGSVPAGTSVRFRFDVDPLTTVTPQTIANTAEASYVDPITASALTSTSQTATIVAVAELSNTGGTVSPWAPAAGLGMIALGLLLVLRAPRGRAGLHRA